MHLRLILVTSLACAASGPAFPVNGLWVHPESVVDRAAADRTLDQARRCGIDNVYVLVFHHEQAWFRTPYCPMSESVAEDFDPLAYCIEAAHKRGIKAHAWFVNGQAGDGGKPGAILSKHPDWDSLDWSGKKALWFDLTNPEVQRFQKDLMLSAVERYPKLDGIHFDYIRFSGTGLSHSPSAVKAFRQATGFEPPKFNTFPLKLHVSGNPANAATTGKVLAAFDTGMPAIIENRLGKGRALLFNWHVERSQSPALDTFVAAKLKQFGAESRPIRLLFSEVNNERYGPGHRSLSAEWLSRIGSEVTDAEIGKGDLDAKDLLVVPNIYIWTEAEAAKLRRLVEAGLNVVWIDGPAANLPDLLAVLGVDRPAAYFRGERLIQPVADDPAMPVAEKPQNRELMEKRDAAWKQWRMDRISDMVREIYRAAKKVRPGVEVTAAVFYTRQAADGVLQDWHRWLRRGYLDYVIPMAYVGNLEGLQIAFDEWEQLPRWRERVIPGLSIYSRQDGKAVPRQSDLVQSQVNLCKNRRTSGIVYFCCHYISHELEPILKGAAAD